MPVVAVGVVVVVGGVGVVVVGVGVGIGAVGGTGSLNRKLEQNPISQLKLIKRI